MNAKHLLVLISSLAIISACGQQADDAVTGDTAQADSGDGMVLPATTASEAALERYMAGWADFENARFITAYGKFLEAAALYKKAAARWPDSALQEDAMFKWGECQFFADRYAASNIRMNNLLPGFIDSLPEKDSRRARIPMDRYGTTTEIARTAAFLLSDAAGYATLESKSWNWTRRSFAGDAGGAAA